jgi:hypothetical protein
MMCFLTASASVASLSMIITISPLLAPHADKLNGIARFANPYIGLAEKQSDTVYYAVSNIDFLIWSRPTSACAQAVVF